MSLPLDVPLRLKGEYADVYSLAPEGAVGFARRRKDDEGFSMIFIEWDQSHWSYSGETDKWTFENHFEPVREQTEMSADGQDKLPADLQQGIEELFAKYVADKQAEQAPEAPVEVEAPASDLFILDSKEKYISHAQRAVEFAAEGVAFVLIGVQETEYEGTEALVPYIVSSYQNEIAGLFLESQLADFAATAFRNVSLALMTKQEKDAEG